MIPDVLKQEERAALSLRTLYGQYGYLPFKMNRFEEYEYYIRNKDFLSSDRFITFTDTTGKLLALKPDVTLSIVKNSTVNPASKHKVYYHENIFRISESTGQYKELMQAGLECIGDIDGYDLYEVISLAAKSLALISENFILQISHLGLLSSVMEQICASRSFQNQAAGYIATKNLHDLTRLCETYQVPSEKAELLYAFIRFYGERNRVLKQMWETLGDIAPEAMAELQDLSRQLEQLPYSSSIIFDFSVVNNMSYYNGIVFSGFLKGINDQILAGGRYDKLMQKLHRKSGAVGFAVYLDLLEQLSDPQPEYDVDVLILYEETTPTDVVVKTAEQYIAAGNTVRVQGAVPQNLRYRTCVNL